MNPFWSFCLLVTAGATHAAMPAFQPFLDTHCMDCHDAEMKKGGLDLGDPWGKKK